MTLCFTYSLSETFYWLAGMPYFWAGTLIIFALSLAIKAYRGSRWSFILCMIVLFLNATLLEQSCVFQGIIAFIAMLFFIVRKNKRGASISCAFWLVSIAGFCMVYFAHSTLARMAGMNNHEQSLLRNILRGFIPAFSMGVMNGLQFFVKPLIYSVIFFLPPIAERISPADEKLSHSVRAWHIVLVMFVISIFMQYMMGVITGGGGLPERGVSLSLWLIYFTWNVLWIFFYRGKLILSEGFRNFCVKFRWPVLVISVLISANFTDCVKALQIAPEYAAERDTRLELIMQQKENGMTILQIPSLRIKPELIFSDFSSMYDTFSPIKDNKVMAKYCGAEKLYAIPYEIYGDSEAVKKIMSGNPEPFAVLADKGDIDAIRLMGFYRDPVRNKDNSGAWNIDEAILHNGRGNERSSLYEAIVKNASPKKFPSCCLLARQIVLGSHEAVITKNSSAP